MNDYIVKFNPFNTNEINNEYMANIESKILEGKSISNEEANYFFTIVSYLTRTIINPDLDNFDFKCDLAVSILCHYLRKLRCKIFLASTQNSILNNVVGHSFMVVQLFVDNEYKNYLLDPTYIQFFKRDKCKKDNFLYLPNNENYILLTPYPGYFLNEKDIDTIKPLLDYGFSLLTSDIARIYGDSFYNTKTGFTLNRRSLDSIDGEVYINSFIKSDERASKSEEELEQLNMNIPLFKDNIINSRNRI